MRLTSSSRGLSLIVFGEGGGVSTGDDVGVKNKSEFERECVFCDFSTRSGLPECDMGSGPLECGMGSGLSECDMGSGSLECGMGSGLSECCLGSMA